MLKHTKKNHPVKHDWMAEKQATAIIALMEE